MLTPGTATRACALWRGAWCHQCDGLEARVMIYDAPTCVRRRDATPTAVWRPMASHFPTRRLRMDAVEFHCEPPSNIPTMVVAFGGWVDAGEAATGAMRYLVRQLAATPLATIDPEEFVDFTTIRPVVRLSAEGQRTIRWPRIALWTWQPPAGGAGLLLFRGVEPQRRWRTYATL